MSSEFPSSPSWDLFGYIYILLLPSFWPSICRLRRSPLECLSYPTLPSTCCELQWAAWRCSRVTPSLMQPDCQLRAFNAEVTGSCTIALSPCFHSCPFTLVPSFGGWRGWLRWIAYCPFFSGQELPRTRRSSAISLSSCGPSFVILGHYPPLLGPRAYYSEWAGAPRSFGPTVLFLGSTILFQLNFIFIYSTFSKKFSVSTK